MAVLQDDVQPEIGVPGRAGWGDSHGRQASWASGPALLDSLPASVTCFRTPDGIPRSRARRVAPVDAGRNTDYLGEAGFAEGGPIDEQPDLDAASVTLRSPGELVSALPARCARPQVL